MPSARFRYAATGILSLFLLWLAVAESGRVSTVLLPHPGTVLSQLTASLFTERDLIAPLTDTLLQWGLALGVGSALGIALGLAAGNYERVYAMLEVPVDFFRSIPSLLILPLALIFLGIGNTTAVFVTAWSTFFYVFVNAAYGVRYSKASYSQVTRILKMNHRQRFFLVILPSALPSISAGVRLAASIALIVTIGTQMVLGRGGLGGEVFNAYQSFRSVEVYSIILLVGGLGYVSNQLLVAAEKKLIHWRGH